MAEKDGSKIRIVLWVYVCTTVRPKGWSSELQEVEIVCNWSETDGYWMKPYTYFSGIATGTSFWCMCVCVNIGCCIYSLDYLQILCSWDDPELLMLLSPPSKCWATGTRHHAQLMLCVWRGWLEAGSKRVLFEDLCVIPIPRNQT